PDNDLRQPRAPDDRRPAPVSDPCAQRARSGSGQMTDAEIEVRIRDFFDANYRQILAEGGAHILTPQALEQARQQVEHYWKKLREIAVNVTETEVRLQLQN